MPAAVLDAFIAAYIGHDALRILVLPLSVQQIQQAPTPSARTR
ncbi:hypothetical protein [Streptomyces sp. NPDC056938]